MRIILVDINERVVDAWRSKFKRCDDVVVRHGAIAAVECDAIVSPANSFGIMTGGVDLPISEYLGWHVQDRLQGVIDKKYGGELPVGKAEIIPTDHPKVPWLISAPTMRTPMDVSKTNNAYLATKAVMDLFNSKFDDGTAIEERIKTVAFPGMGTGTGRIPPLGCAIQMYAAIFGCVPPLV